jgi:hypothetical protein
MGYSNENCTPCTTEQTVITPCGGCSVILPDTCVIRKGPAISCLGIAVDDTYDTVIDKIADKICSADNYIFDTTCLSGSGAINSNIGDAVNLIIAKICDTVVSYPTFNASCLGGTSVETMSNTINYLITQACAPSTLTFSGLNWTCLTSPASDDIDDVFQGLIDNIKANKVTFGAGFTVTAQSCGSLVEYSGSGSPGIAITTSTGTTGTGLGIGQFIEVTPSSGINAAYNLTPRVVNEAAIAFPVGSNVTTSFATIRLRWDKYVEFDGSLTIAAALLNGVDQCYNSLPITLGTLPTKYRPTHGSGAKQFPGIIHVTDAGSSNLPGCTEPWACSYIGIISVANTGVVEFIITDCRYAADMETKTFDSALVWLSQVQYYTV